MIKQATAFFLAIVYLAFTTGMVWTLSHSGEYAFEKVAAGDNAETDAFQKYSKGIQLTKAHKHLAAIGKIKLPRPGFTNSSATGLVCYRTIAKITQKEHLPKLVLPQISLHLQNCVFLI